VGVALDPAGVSEGVERGDDSALAAGERLSDVLRRERHGRATKKVEDLGLEGRGGNRSRRFGAGRGVEELKVGDGLMGEPKGHRVWGTGPAVLDGKESVIAPGGEKQGRVVPGSEVAAAAQAVAELTGGRLAHVVDEEEAERELALERPERAEERRDLGGGVLVDASDPDEGVEDEQTRRDLGDGGPQAGELVFLVEAEEWHVEEEQGRVLEGDAAHARDGVEANPQIGRVVLGPNFTFCAGPDGKILWVAPLYTHNSIEKDHEGNLWVCSWEEINKRSRY